MNREGGNEMTKAWREQVEKQNTKCGRIIKHTVFMSEEGFNKMYDKLYQESEREYNSGLLFIMR
jgi:hypothetical protein